MNGKIARDLRVIAREMSKDRPELFDFYYKAAKKLYKVKLLRRI